MEFLRTPDDQVGDPGRKKQPGADVGLPASGASPQDPEYSLSRVQRSGHQEPLPEVGPVEQQETPERDVQEMSPVEHL